MGATAVTLLGRRSAALTRLRENAPRAAAARPRYQIRFPTGTKPAYAQRRLTTTITTTVTDKAKTIMSSRLLVLALALQPWRGAARHLRGRRRLDAADDVAVPPEIREALNDAVDAVVDDGGL